MARTTVDCPKCRAKFQIDDQWPDADCPACHAHIELDLVDPGAQKKFTGRLDCSACKNVQSMERTAVDRMSLPVVLIGWIILVPSALGMLWAVLGFLWTVLRAISRMGFDPHSRTSTDEMAAGIAAFVGMGFGGMSMVGLLLGCLLIMKKNVYQCRICGAILDRT
ncbi:MAG: hypothetical protein WC708_14740 [Lentisphaeria bacterium]